VLLVEAGGSDDVPSVMQANQWYLNLGSERDWGFVGQPNRHLNGRSIPLNMSKVLGGGSSINVMAWARGHKNNWDFFAAEARDPAWSYEAMLDIYRRIEDWHGAPDPKYRGTGGLLFVQPAPTPTRSLLPWWKERAQLGFRLSRVTRSHDGRRWRRVHPRFARSRWKTPIRISLVYLPLYGSTYRWARYTHRNY
jgi:choline dehydrogenase-like flavoprotein